MSFTLEILGEGLTAPLSFKESAMAENKQMLVDVIGDSGPFSQLGKSIGYRLTAGDCQFLIDCGAPVFQLLGPDGLNEIEGIIGTHGHEDHKRWFTDIALFQKFSNEQGKDVELYGSRKVLDDYRLASIAALERTLTPDSKRITNFSYDDYIRTHCIAPEPKYRLQRVRVDDEGKAWRVVDNNENVVPPDQARVFTEDGIHRPRMLLKDPEDGIWVEPEAYYSFDDERFYDVENHTPHTHSNGLKITPIKASAWHGLSTTSLLFEFEGETLFFSSDTTYNPELWNELTNPVKPDKNVNELDEDHYVVEDEINDYIEQVWSQKRKQKALKQYDQEYVMVHDVTGPWATVHTDYKNLESYDEPLLLTHSPDVFTTVHPLAHLGKTFTVRGNELHELTDRENEYPMVADCYYKEFSQYFVGFEDKNGDHVLVQKGPGQYDVQQQSDVDLSNDGEYEVVMTISLYEEIGGEYFPYLENDNEEYIIRPDGEVEHVIHDDESSSGTVKQGIREELTEARLCHGSETASVQTSN